MMKLISINPSRNYAVLGEVEASSEKDVVDKVNQARTAFPSWSTMPLTERCNILTTFIDASKKHGEEIAHLIASETGRPITSSRINVAGGIEYFEAYIRLSERYLSPQVTIDTDTELHRIYREPWGVVAAICPWNYPYMNVVWQCGQALIAGNTIVYKNSEEDPLFSQLLESLVRQSAIPPGVFNVVYGDGALGDVLVHQDIDMISFTGSTPVGQALTAIAAKKLIPIVTELGGSSPLILFEDVDVTDEIIAYISGRRFKNAGQACDAVKRLIVHKSKFNDVVDRLTRYVTALKIGDAVEEDTEIGPLVAERQVKRIDAQVKDAVKKGGTIITGGGRPTGLRGAYYLPTILTTVSADMRVWCEETFGPVLPIVPFATEEEAITLANDTEYGLSAHILTQDNKRFERVAGKIKAGSISQNTVGFWSPENPFGGYKKSGMGRIHGSSGFDDVTQLKVVAEEK